MRLLLFCCPALEDRSKRAHMHTHGGEEGAARRVAAPCSRALSLSLSPSSSARARCESERRLQWLQWLQWPAVDHGQQSVPACSQHPQRACACCALGSASGRSGAARPRPCPDQLDETVETLPPLHRARPMAAAARPLPDLSKRPRRSASPASPARPPPLLSSPPPPPPPLPSTLCSTLLCSTLLSPAPAISSLCAPSSLLAAFTVTVPLLSRCFRLPTSRPLLCFGAAFPQAPHHRPPDNPPLLPYAPDNLQPCTATVRSIIHRTSTPTTTTTMAADRGGRPEPRPSSTTNTSAKCAPPRSLSSSSPA